MNDGILGRKLAVATIFAKSGSAPNGHVPPTQNHIRPTTPSHQLKNHSLQLLPSTQEPFSSSSSFCLNPCIHIARLGKISPSIPNRFPICHRSNRAMGFSNGLSSSSSSSTEWSHYNTHKAFLISNYILIGAASSCIFLTLSLRLIPAVCGLLLIFLHIFTIIGAISGCTAANAGTSQWYATHMVVTVLTAIFQGSVAVFVFTRTSDFLGGLKSYVREEDGEIILKLAGGLCVLIFCMEWMVLGLAFLLRYYDHVEGDESGSEMKRTGKMQDLSRGPWAYQA